MLAWCVSIHLITIALFYFDIRRSMDSFATVPKAHGVHFLFGIHCKYVTVHLSFHLVSPASNSLLLLFIKIASLAQAIFLTFWQCLLRCIVCSKRSLTSTVRYLLLQSLIILPPDFLSNKIFFFWSSRTGIHIVMVFKVF